MDDHDVDADARMDELFAFLGAVDGADLATDEWLLPLDKDARFAPPFELTPDPGVAHDRPSEKKTATCAFERLVPSIELPKRRTRKQELDTLREYAHCLTRQLHALKRAAGIDIGTPVAAIPPDQARLIKRGATDRTRKTVCMWERLSAKQLKYRQVSEQENRILREAATIQARRAKKMLRTLYKRVEEERRQLASVFTKPSRPIGVSLPDDEVVFQQLAEGMDEAYADIDRIFHSAKMHEVPVSDIRYNVQDFEPGKWRVEIRNVHAMPFVFTQVDQAAWRVMSNKIASNEKELRGGIRFTYRLPNGVDMVMHQRSVARRYRERERTILLLRSLTEPLPGISIETTKFFVIMSGERSVSGPTAIIQIYLIARSSATTAALQRANDALRQRTPRLDFHADDEMCGLKAWEKSIASELDGIEDLLISGNVGIQ